MNANIISLLIVLLGTTKSYGITKEDIETGGGQIPSVAYTKSSSFFVEEGSVKGNSKTIDTKVGNLTTISCYKEGSFCISSGNLIAVAVDTLNFKLNATYKFKTNTTTTLVPVQSSIIEGSKYFLIYISTNGLMRWESGVTDAYGVFNLTKTYPKNFPSKSLRVISNTTLAAITAVDAPGVAIVDFTTLTSPNFFNSLANGYLAYLDQDPSKAMMVDADKLSIVVFEYVKGAVLQNGKVDFYIAAIDSITQSNLIVVLSEDVMYAFDAGKSVQDYLIMARLEIAPRSAVFNPFTGKLLIVGGLGKSQTIAISNPEAALCHPLCKGCNAGLSPSSCTECSAEATLVDGICTLKSPSNPPGGFVNLNSIVWVPPNKVQEKDLTYQEMAIKYKDEALKEENRLYLYIGAGGAAAFVCCVCLLCICCCCCGSSEEKDKYKGIQNNASQKANPNNGRAQIKDQKRPIIITAPQKETHHIYHYSQPPMYPPHAKVIRDRPLAESYRRRANDTMDRGRRMEPIDIERDRLQQEAELERERIRNANLLEREREKQRLELEQLTIERKRIEEAQVTKKRLEILNQMIPATDSKKSDPLKFSLPVYEPHENDNQFDWN